MSAAGTKRKVIMAKKCLPVGSILTIAAAGSETSKGCVITNEITGQNVLMTIISRGLNLLL